MGSKNIVELALGSSDLSTLVTALKAGDLVAALQGKGPFTVFAPSNAAFAKLPKATLESLLEPKNKGKLVDILTYQVVSGAAVFSKDLKPTQNVKTLQGDDVLVTSSSAGVLINRNSKVIAADIAATNGVVHIIDTVLMPPTPTTTTASGPSKNIVELAQGSSDLSTLVTALKAGDLVAALQGKGPFTVFAPSNAAFAKLPKATLESVLEPKNKGKLVDILTYHVVSGAAVSSKDLKPTQNVKTLQGDGVLVTSSRYGVLINGNSKVIAADIAATNGVVHIIDTVLIPPTPTATTTTRITTTSRPSTTSFRSTANIPALDQIKDRVLVTDSALDQRLTSGVILSLHILCVLWWVTVY